MRSSETPVNLLLTSQSEDLPIAVSVTGYMELSHVCLPQTVTRTLRTLRTLTLMTMVVVPLAGN